MTKNKQNPRIEFSPSFNRQLKIAPRNIKAAFNTILPFFREDPTHDSLRRHFLKGRYAGYASIDITDDYRALFKEKQSAKEIIIRFYYIGTHDELYG